MSKLVKCLALLLLPAALLLVTAIPATEAAILIDIPEGAVWKYFKGTAEPPADWNSVAFDDSVWASGPSGFGYADGDDATLLNDMKDSYVSVYIRHQFDVADPTALTSLTLTVDYDDGFVAYLNGVEVARANMTGSPPAFDTLANGEHEASGSSSNQPAVIDISGSIGLLVPGTNVLALQGHNFVKWSSDFSLIPTLIGASDPPASPTGLVASTVSDTRIDLAWTDNSSNETGFELEFSTSGSGGPFTPLATLPADTTSYSHTGLSPQTQYCYQVRAVNSAGASDYAAPACATTQDAFQATSLPIVAGDIWRYFKGRSEPPAGWNNIGFDDSGWTLGPSGFGYADGDDATVFSDMQGQYLSLYIRREFLVDDPSAILSLTLTVDYDDGFVAYLNGVEVARANMTGTPPAFDTPANGEHEASGSSSNQPAVIDISGSIGLLVPGTNVLAIQGHNQGISSSDFSLIPGLTAVERPPAPATLFTIAEGDVWRYFKGNSEPPAGWNNIGFDDSSWPTGPSGFGYGDGDDATILSDMLGAYVSVYIRHEFTVQDPDQVTDMVLTVDYDDGFVAYLNGVEVARANISGSPPAYNTLANGEHEASRGSGSQPQPVGIFDISSFTNLLVAGTNVLAIQGHNFLLSSSDFSLIPTLEGTFVPPDPDLPIVEGDVWRYFKGTSEPPANWKAIDFDDSAWLLGPSGFGYGDGDDATVLSDMQGAYTSVYIRRKFHVDDPNAIASLMLRVDYDDGFVAYLNGVEVARANVSGSPPAFNALASSDHEASGGDFSPQPVGEFDISSQIGLLVAGSNVLAIQGHNVTKDSSDFSLIPTLDTTSAPPVNVLFEIAAGETWRYFKGVEEPPAGWNNIGFDDSSWLSGPSGFGYGDGDDATVLSDMQFSYSSVYIRKAFTVADPDAVGTMVLTVDYDDGFVAYINGAEVARANIAGTPPAFDATASTSHEASGGDTQPHPAQTFDISNFIGLLVPGTNVLALQGHNEAISSSDFSLIPTLQGTDQSTGAQFTLLRQPYLQQPSATGITIVWTTAEPGTPAVRYSPDWTDLSFDDSDWLSGPSGFGYGDGDDATVLSDMRNNYTTVYMRKRFTVADPDTVAQIVLSVDYDDGFVAYLNGVEVARGNVDGMAPTFNDTAHIDHEASGGDIAPQPVAVFDISAFKGLLVPGENLLAVQGFNVSLSSSDFSLIPTLELHTPAPTTVIAQGDTWSYFKGTSEPVSPNTQVAGVSTFFSALGGFYQHQVDITGLQPRTRYTYRIFVDGVELLANERLTFRTAPSATDGFVTFALWGDVGQRSSAQFAVRDRLERDVFDLALLVGDVAYNSGTYQELQDNFFGVYRELMKYVPLATVLGDHEYQTASGQPILDTFVLPRNGPPGREERNFSFDYGNVHIVGLDAQQIDQAQADWLAADLAATSRSWKIVLIHGPLFGEGSRHPITETDATNARALLAPIFETYGVDMVFSGDNHMYGRSAPLIGAQAGPPYGTATTIENGGVVYITTGGGGHTLYPAYTDSFHQPPVGMTVSAHHYSKVVVDGCTLTLRAVGTDGSTLDSFVLDRCDDPLGRANAQPAGTLPFTTTQVDISLTTALDATCKYETVPGVDYFLMGNTFQVTGGTGHSSTITGLSHSTTYSFYVRCSDGAGTVNTSDFVITFTISPPGPTLVEARIAASTDDAYNAPTGWPGYSHTDTVVYAGAPGGSGPTWGGWRFTGLNIPANATILDAYVEFTQAGWGYTVTTTLALEKSAAPATFSPGSSPSARWANRTSFELDWTWPKATPGSKVHTPSLVGGIQELVSTFGAINELVLLEDGTGVPQGEYHTWESFDASPSQAAMLRVEYSTGP